MFTVIALTTADDKMHGWDVFDRTELYSTLRPVGFIDGSTDNAALIQTLCLNNYGQAHTITRYVVTPGQFASKLAGPLAQRKGDHLKDGYPVRWESTKAGCIFDGAQGWHNNGRAIRLAWDLGMVYTNHDEILLDWYEQDNDGTLTLPDGETIEKESIGGLIIDQGGILDEAIEWLNEYIAPAGCEFLFDDGFYLREIDDEDEG